MENNKNQQKKLISIVITLCSLFLALILSVTTFAWFAMNKSVNGTGASISVAKNIDLGIYKIKILKREGADNAKDVSGSGNVVLTEYDTVFTDKNVNTSIIMRLELGDLPLTENWEEGMPKYAPFRLRVKCGSMDETKEDYIRGTDGYLSYLLGLPENEGKTTEELEEEWISGEGGPILPEKYWRDTNADNFGTVLSNIIGIRCGLGSKFTKKVPNGVDKDGKTIYEDVSVDLNSLTDDNDIYTEAKDYLETLPTGAPVLPEQTFILLGGEAKRGILQFEFSNYDNYVMDNGLIVVYIDVNYNNELITLFSEQLGFSTTDFSSGTGDAESVHFESDLTNCFIFMGDKD